MIRLWLGLAAASAATGVGIESTRHNLSVGGPGPVRASAETEICVFCHAAHVPEGPGPLWNHETSARLDYRPYDSPLLGSRPGLIDGSSRLCLSCHDGTIAVGAVRGRDGAIRVERTDGGGRLRVDAPGNLGTDLSGSHPVSIRYVEAVRRRSSHARTWLQDTPALPGADLLDAAGEVQCTSCHDAHRDPAAAGMPVPPFWKGDSYGDVCEACHVAPVAERGHGDPALMPKDCGSCHVGHGEPGEPLLPAVEEANCFACHGPTSARREAVEDGRMSAVADPVRVDDLFQRAYTHPVGSTVGAHRPEEDARTAGARTQRHVECADCHPTHAHRGPDRPGFLPSAAPGGPQLDGRPEQELCFECHGGRANLPYGATDKLAEFDPGNASHHAVIVPGRQRSVSLLRGSGDTLSCSDCHGPDGDDPRRGPHGSRNPFLLKDPYQVRDGAPDAVESYGACYACHDRGIVLSGESFPGHAQHVVTAKISCYTCHDSHGSPGEPGLIRFNKDLRNGMVAPSKSGVLDYDAETGTCRLACHGVDHDPLGYP